MLADEDIVYVSASGDISAIVTADGKIYTWGRTRVRLMIKVSGWKFIVEYYTIKVYNISTTYIDRCS